MKKTMNKYRQLAESIHVPDGLNDRVLRAARESVRETPVRRTRHVPLFRAGLCAALALVLVLGGISLRPAPAAGVDGEAGSDVPGTPALPAQRLVPTFGLMAYAAGAGQSYGAAPDGSIGFALGEGCVAPEYGDFTGCLFQITGENIAEVRLSIDRGGLYRYVVHDNLTDEEIDGFRQAMAEDRIAPTAIIKRDDGTWYVPEMTALGSSVQAAYDPEVQYGFWLSPEEAANEPGLGITIAAQMDADFFDGGLLTVTVVSADGTEQTQNYRLHSGYLKIEWDENHDIIVFPELASQEDLDRNFCIYGIYAVPEN